MNDQIIYLYREWRRCLKTASEAIRLAKEGQSPTWHDYFEPLVEWDYVERVLASMRNRERWLLANGGDNDLVATGPPG
ncbi:hypothetical protein [Zavarzinella formosa]|uniref:hypothetical protein n=1 Tax=Zavarzinella formosa TaxID=360055 RepID=UPI00030E1E85|nr:hypothetical protein [Zavarzinella formosa]